MDLSKKSELKALREAMERALGPLMLSENIAIRIGNFRYEGDGSLVKIGVEVTPAGTNPTEAKHRRGWEYAVMVNSELKAEDLDRVVKLNGRDYRIAGYNPRRKQQVLAEQVGTGKLYWFPTQTVRVACGRVVPLAKAGKGLLKNVAK